jgi:hypothetical protein
MITARLLYGARCRKRDRSGFNPLCLSRSLRRNRHPNRLHCVRPEIRQLQTKAETGDASAQATLGKAHQEGNGVTQNDALALKWSRKAAEQGDSDAENTLGVMYRMGEGVARQRRGGSLVPQVRETRRSEGDV